MSLSYGVSEAFDGATFNAYVNALYEQGTSEGVSIFVSAGDAGAAKYDQDDTDGFTKRHRHQRFLPSPYNVAVGGTDFGDTFAETASSYWNPTNTAAYGSAISDIQKFPERLLRELA